MACSGSSGTSPEHFHHECSLPPRCTNGSTGEKPSASFRCRHHRGRQSSSEWCCGCHPDQSWCVLCLLIRCSRPRAHQPARSSNSPTPHLSHGSGFGLSATLFRGSQRGRCEVVVDVDQLGEQPRHGSPI